MPKYECTECRTWYSVHPASGEKSGCECGKHKGTRGGRRKNAGRPTGTTRGKNKTITITVSKEHKVWLESKDLSYAKTIAKLIDAAINEDT